MSMRFLPKMKIQFVFINTNCRDYKNRNDIDLKLGPIHMGNMALAKNPTLMLRYHVTS